MKGTTLMRRISHSFVQLAYRASSQLALVTLCAFCLTASYQPVFAQSGTYAYTVDQAGNAHSSFNISPDNQAIGLKVGVINMPPQSSRPVFRQRIYRPNGSIA